MEGRYEGSRVFGLLYEMNKDKVKDENSDLLQPYCAFKKSEWEQKNGVKYNTRIIYYL